MHSFQLGTGRPPGRKGDEITAEIGSRDARRDRIEPLRSLGMTRTCVMGREGRVRGQQQHGATVAPGSLGHDPPGPAGTGPGEPGTRTLLPR